MPAITYTLTNTNTTTSIDIRYFSFTDDTNITHVANLSNFGGDAVYSGSSNLRTHDKTYDTGGYLRKLFTNDSHARVCQYSTHTGTTLTLRNITGALTDYPNGVQAGWVASGGNYSGLSVVSVLSDTQVIMSGTPSSTPTFGDSITFSTTTNVLILQSTSGLGAGWSITENGYTPPPSGAPAYIVSVIDSTHVRVNRLPDTTPVYNNSAYTYFTSSTNFLTLNETTANLDTGWSASGNGYNGQTIISIVDGNTVIMSDLPGSFPSSGGTITFTDQAPQFTLPPLGYGTFDVDYGTPTHLVGNNYPGTITVHAKENGSNVTKLANTFVNISAPLVAVPTFTPRNPGSSGYGRSGGYTYSVTTYTYDDGSTLTVVTNEQTQQSYNIATEATDGGITSANTNVSTSPDGVGGEGCTCYLAGSLIAMADGRFINIEDVKVGDSVLGAFGEINEILALMHVKLGNRKMYKLNQEHDTTYEEIHISTDKKMHSIDNDATYIEYGEYWKCILGDGTEQMLLNVGVSRERLHTLKEGVELQTITGPKLVDSLEAYDLPSDTTLYNFVLSGSHTFFVNGYAVASWPREDDFDYDQWKPKVN